MFAKLAYVDSFFIRIIALTDNSFFDSPYCHLVSFSNFVGEHLDDHQK